MCEPKLRVVEDEMNFQAPTHESDAAAARGLSDYGDVDFIVPASVINDGTSQAHFVALEVISLTSEKIC